MFVCETCNKNCTSKAGLSLHLKKCLIIKEFKCEYCNSIFKTNYNLKIHLQNISCQEQKKLVELKKQDEIDNLKEQFNLEKEEKNKIKQEELIVSKLNQEYENKIKQQELLIAKLTQDYENKIKQQELLIAKLTHENAQFLSINQLLLKNISVNKLVNELPILTGEILHNFILNIRFTDSSTYTCESYCKQLSENGLNKYVYKTDINRGHLIYNLEGKETRDDKGKDLSEMICNHPLTKDKIIELKQLQLQIKQLLNTNTLSDSDASIKLDELHSITKLVQELVKPNQIQKYIARYIKLR
jgi:hypothetical protein